MSNFTAIKKTVFSVIFFLLLISSTFASETRQATMGNTSIFLKDDANVFLFPGTLLQYPDLVVAEMRTKKANGSYSIGLHMGYGSDMASGLYVNVPISSLILTTGLAQFGGLNTTINNAYGFLFATKAAGFDMGFGVLSAGSNFETGSGAAKVEESLYYIGIVGGISSKDLDLGLLIELPSIEQKAGGTTNKYSGFGLDAHGRYYMMKRAGTTIFPVGRVVFGSASFKNGTDVDFSALTFAAGLGAERPINEDNLLVVGIEAFGYSSLTADVKNGTESVSTTMTIPGIYVGVESRISSWLIGRVGAAQVNQQVKNEITPDGGDTAETTTNISNFKLALGLGMEFGNFLVDFAFNEGILFDGPAIISNTGELLATRLSVTYNFGGNDE